MKIVKWILLGLVLGVVFNLSRIPDSNLHIVFCDVGQGDSALMIWGKLEILFDTGPDTGRELQCLDKHMPWGDRVIEVVVISHPQKDHNGALKDVLKRYKVGKLVESARVGDVIRYKEIEIEIVNGNIDSEGKVLGIDNDSSLVSLVKYRNFSTLITGDISSKQELAMIESGVLKKINLLKVAHHGSKYSSTDKFLEMITPKIAVVSVGANNNYGHPNGGTLIRLDTVGAMVFRTDLQGEIEVVVDDKGQARVKKEK